MKGKDHPKGAGKRVSFRSRVPFSREARLAQAMDDEADVCTGKCFKLVPLGDLVPGHDARGVIDPVPGRQAVRNSNDPVPVREKHHIRTTQCLGDERLTTRMTHSLDDRS